jgi:uncharacterized membrane protein YqgA involved in biofilm formation
MVIPVGTLVNAAAVAAGGICGTLIGARMSEHVRSLVFQALGLSMIILSLQMAFKSQEILILILSLLLGGITGCLLRLEARSTRAVEALRDRLKASSLGRNENFVEGFINTVMICCVGAMAVLGSIDEGITGNAHILYTKSLLDFFICLALGSTFGASVSLAGAVILIYQGTITLLASYLQPWVTGPVLNEFTGVGGVLVLGISINLLELRRINVLDLLPSLIWVCILCKLFL